MRAASINDVDDSEINRLINDVSILRDQLSRMRNDILELTEHIVEVSVGVGDVGDIRS